MRDKREFVSEHRYNEDYIKGKFGEYLVMYQLMVYRGWDVEYVDYFGADLIAIDTSVCPKKKYAIQVKLRHFYKDGQTNSDFDFNAEKKLRLFCQKFGSENEPLIPLVAYVNINHDQSINTFIINVNDLADIRCEIEQSYGGSSEYGIGTAHSNNKNRGYICNSAKGLNNLLDDPRITYYRLTNFEAKQMPLDNLGIGKDCSYLDNEKNDLNEENSVNHGNNQIGDFGEWFFMMKAVATEFRPFLVKSVGADIIMFDTTKDNMGQAISIKTFSKKEHDKYEFEYSNVDKLKEFSSKWGLEPKVVFQQMIYRHNGEKKEYYKMYNFMMSLSYLENANQEYLYKSSHGYTINWANDNLLKIQNDSNIDFDMVVFDEPFLYEKIRDENLTNNKIGNKLLSICGEKNISINELSNKVEIPEDNLNKIINREYIPSLEIALRISNILDVSVNELFQYGKEATHAKDSYK